MADERKGLFWDILEGRVPPPASARLLGWTFVSYDDGKLRLSFEAKPEFLNPLGTVQGGFLVAMLDDTVGPAATAVLPPGQFTQTLEIKTSFLRPAKPGKLFGEARIVHRGRDIIFVEATLSDPEGHAVAAASATMRVISLEK
jgi:uncharacterized protein (TIGR00369 family)